MTKTIGAISIINKNFSLCFSFWNGRNIRINRFVIESPKSIPLKGVISNILLPINKAKFWANVYWIGIKKIFSSENPGNIILGTGSTLINDNRRGKVATADSK